MATKKKEIKKPTPLTQDEFYKLAGEFNALCQTNLHEKGISFLGCISAELVTGETGTANITACAGDMMIHICNELGEIIMSKLT